MKRLAIILMVMGILLFSNSCHDDFLEEEIFSDLSSNGFFKTEKDLKSGVIGIYDAFQGNSYFGESVIAMADYPTEYIRSYWSNPLDVYQVSSALSADPNQRQVSDLWKKTWTVNNLCNMVINRAEDVEMDENIKKKIVAEARFLRAMNNFYQVRFYGTNIPLIHSETTSLKDLDVIPSNRNELYNSIIADFEFAEANLPPISEEGRATSWAATAFLGKVYLKLAGYSEDPETGEMIKGEAKNYQKAKVYIDKIVTEGPFTLMSTPIDVWGGPKNETEANAEIIFAIKYKEGVGEGNVWTSRFVGKGNGWVPFSFKTISSTWEFYETYEDGDLRASNEMMKVRSQDKKEEWYNDDFPHIWKYVSSYDPTFSMDWVATAGNDYGDDVVVIRYADILLMQTEVDNELEGFTANTLSGINRVRTRANVPEFTVSSVSAMSEINGETPGSNKDKLKELLIIERKKELIAEGHGWFDYVRLNILMREMTKYYVWGEFNAASKKRYNLYPIYNSDISLNENLTQNWGW